MLFGAIFSVEHEQKQDQEHDLNVIENDRDGLVFSVLASARCTTELQFSAGTHYCHYDILTSSSLLFSLRRLVSKTNSGEKEPHSSFIPINNRAFLKCHKQI